MHKKSAGLLIYRILNNRLEVLLVHPGGPFWAKKESGAWSIPKGEFDDTEEPLEAAKREVSEELGIKVDGRFMELNPVKQKSGKSVQAWAVEFNLNAEEINSNYFEMEWPPKSGRKKQFPEVDKAAWFDIPEASQKINPAQVPFLIELASYIEKSL